MNSRYDFKLDTLKNVYFKNFFTAAITSVS